MKGRLVMKKEEKEKKVNKTTASKKATSSSSKTGTSKKSTTKKEENMNKISSSKKKENLSDGKKDVSENEEILEDTSLNDADLEDFEEEVTIEDNKENAVRVVSNALGWYIIRSLDNDNSELSNYLIERTIDLFRIAQNMQISEKTLIFIMTLFTTVGTYCCKQIKYQTYLNKILNALKNEEYIRIKTAIELRTNENTMWDKLYDNRTKELTQKFLKELKNKTEI